MDPFFMDLFFITFHFNQKMQIRIWRLQKSWVLWIPICNIKDSLLEFLFLKRILLLGGSWSSYTQYIFSTRPWQNVTKVNSILSKFPRQYLFSFFINAVVVNSCNNRTLSPRSRLAKPDPDVLVESGSAIWSNSCLQGRKRSVSG